MIYLILYLFALMTAIGTGFLAGWSDFKGMIIPNYMPLMIIFAFIVAFIAEYMAGVDIIFYDLKAHLISGGGLFVITFLLYVLKIFGGGDAKLMTAYGFWVGVAGLVNYLFYMALCGAVFGVAALIIRKWKPFKSPAPESWLGRVQAGDSAVPYGIPIVVGALVAFVSLDYLFPETLSLFLMPEGS